MNTSKRNNLKKYHTLRLILGDQLNAKHSWFSEKNDNVLYVIAELHQEAAYVKHHIQKLCAFFMAMENFANALRKAGHHVIYLNLDDTKDIPSLPELIKKLCHQYCAVNIEYQRPDEYRLYQQLNRMRLGNKITLSIADTEHFLLPFNEIPDFFSKDSHHKMEFFYRKMRKRFSLLMDEDKPLGGQWNYDTDNRKKLQPEDIADIPEPLLFSNNVSTIINRIKQHNIPYFGEVKTLLPWPVNRTQSLALLNHFCQYCLPLFGTFQDAMTEKSPSQWSLYHSRLSFSINTKMLHPLQVIHTAINTYTNSNGQITLAQVEGFVRQILGWREYIRGIYWSNMPDYSNKNSLNAKRDLPHYFWNGQTSMRCMQHTITQSLDYAYAHHIQRLMITGNFCLLTGIDPDQVDQWYLGIYIDAIEWVEMPNTRGMSQYADNGLVATKPYAAGGNYIKKMSDYCKDCDYKVNKKETADACPFNSLYWHFMIQHRKKLERNPRIGMIYRNWDKQNNRQQTAVLNRANECLKNIEKL